ncbi:MAG: hypothetical protein AAB515_01625 [Patescibacteria group bacterium]
MSENEKGRAHEEMKSEQPEVLLSDEEKSKIMEERATHDAWLLNGEMVEEDTNEYGHDGGGGAKIVTSTSLEGKKTFTYDLTKKQVNELQREMWKKNGRTPEQAKVFVEASIQREKIVDGDAIQINEWYDSGYNEKFDFIHLAQDSVIGVQSNGDEVRIPYEKIFSIEKIQSEEPEKIEDGTEV